MISQEEMWAAAEHLNGLLEKNGPRKAASEAPASWRVHRSNFKNKEDCTLEPGIITMSPAWFQLGHEVSAQQMAEITLANTLLQTATHQLEVSVMLKPKTFPLGTEAWLESMRLPHYVLGGLLNVLHPELYQASLAALVELQGQEKHEPPMEKWGSTFSAVSLISNRSAPLHRDPRSHPSWYDILVSFGSYTEATLCLPGLGLELPYPSGTVVAFSGNLLRHGVTEHDGERVCLAYFMREKVHERLQVPLAGWMTTDKISADNIP